MVLHRGVPQSPRSKAGAKWLSKIRKSQVAPKGLHQKDNFFLLSFSKFIDVFSYKIIHLNFF